MMKTQFCSVCGKDTLQNSTPPKGLTKELGWRCTGCGHPKRTGGNAKNYGLRVGGKIMFLGPGQ